MTRLAARSVQSFALGALLAVPCLYAPLFDDAYIHARVVERVISYGEPYFNAHDGLKTDSATGYVILLATFTRVLGDALSATRVLQALVVAFLPWSFDRLLGARRAAGAYVLVALTLPALLWAAYGGMETALAGLCVARAAALERAGRHTLALFALSCAASVRIELGLLLLLALVAGAFTWRSALALSPSLACALFDVRYYGTLVPHAALAKARAYDLPWPDSLVNAATLGLGGAAGLCTALFLAACALRLRARIRREATRPMVDALYLQALALLCAWALSRSLVFSWYVASFAACAGAAALLTQLDGTRAERVNACLLLCALAGTAIVGIRRDFGAVKGELATGTRASRYADIGRVLYERCPACTVLSSEIGGLGYGFRGHVFDALALADASARRFHPLAVPAERATHRAGAIPPAYVAFRAPDFVVSMPVFSEAFRRSAESAIFTRYTCAIAPDRPKDTLWGDRTIDVFARERTSASPLTTVGCGAPDPSAARF